MQCIMHDFIKHITLVYIAVAHTRVRLRVGPPSLRMATAIARDDRVLYASSTQIHAARVRSAALHRREMQSARAASAAACRSRVDAQEKHFVPPTLVA